MCLELYAKARLTARGSSRCVQFCKILPFQVSRGRRCSCDYTQMRDRQLADPRSAYNSVRFFHFALRGDGDVSKIIRKCEIDAHGFSKCVQFCKILPFQVSRGRRCSCDYTQKRDRQLADPRSAYNSVKSFHFALRRDGDVSKIIRKCEIDGSRILEVRTNL